MVVTSLVLWSIFWKKKSIKELTVETKKLIKIDNVCFILILILIFIEKNYNKLLFKLRLLLAFYFLFLLPTSLNIAYKLLFEFLQRNGLVELHLKNNILSTKIWPFSPLLNSGRVVLFLANTILIIF